MMLGGSLNGHLLLQWRGGVAICPAMRRIFPQTRE
jgi:hypothetical protein